MNITRHNYEEFFILYMDNELGSDDRRQVELFVQENPDLKEELDWLLQSRLVPDSSLVFSNKEQLMKTSGVESINTTNYEEWLLFYTDNELTIEQKAAVEEFAAAHPAIQKELALLQKTKVQPEQDIIFQHKELLYRNEEKIKVVAINWRRIAVAAALLLAVSTTALLVINNNTKKADSIEGVALVEPTVIKSTPANTQEQQKRIINTDAQVAENNENKKSDEVADITSPVVTDKNIETIKEKNKRTSIIAIKEEAPVIAQTSIEKKKTNDLPEPRSNPNVNGLRDQDNPTLIADNKTKEPLTISTQNIDTPDVTPGNSQSLNNVVTAASIESVDPTDAAQPGKKNKLRGFFRKVTRTFEKATNIKATDDEDRLLLGGLAIKL